MHFAFLKSILVEWNGVAWSGVERKGKGKMQKQSKVKLTVNRGY